MAAGDAVRAGYHGNLRSDVIGLLPGRLGRVLDIGGGTGATSGALKRLGRADRSVVVDLVAGAPAPGIDRMVAGDLEDRAVIARVLAEEAPLDTVLCLDVLEHLRDPWDVAGRLAGALAPGGIMVVSLPNIRFVSVVGPLVLRGRFDYRQMGVMDRTHLRWFTRSSALALVAGAGLEIEAVQANIGRRSRLAHRLSFGLLEGFFAYQYVIRARKAG